jgi:hypothetical protein
MWQSFAWACARIARWIVRTSCRLPWIGIVRRDVFSPHRRLGDRRYAARRTLRARGWRLFNRGRRRSVTTSRSSNDCALSESSQISPTRKPFCSSWKKSRRAGPDELWSGCTVSLRPIRSLSVSHPWLLRRMSERAVSIRSHDTIGGIGFAVSLTPGHDGVSDADSLSSDPRLPVQPGGGIEPCHASIVTTTHPRVPLSG